MTLTEIKFQFIREAVASIFLSEGTYHDLTSDNPDSNARVVKWEPFEDDHDSEVIGYIDDAVANMAHIITGDLVVNTCWLLGVNDEGVPEIMGFPFIHEANAVMSVHDHFKAVVTDTSTAMRFCEENDLNFSNVQVTFR
jgi:hypothetical protein